MTEEQKKAKLKELDEIRVAKALISKKLAGVKTLQKQKF